MEKNSREARVGEIFLYAISFAQGEHDQPQRNHVPRLDDQWRARTGSAIQIRADFREGDEDSSSFHGSESGSSPNGPDLFTRLRFL